MNFFLREVVDIYLKIYKIKDKGCVREVSIGIMGIERK